MIEHDPSPSLRVELRFKNANLLRALEAQFGVWRKQGRRGRTGVLRQAAQILGISYNQLGEYLRLSSNPYQTDGTLKPSAAAVAEKLSLSPQQAFPPELYRGLFGPRFEEIEPTALLSLSSRPVRLLESGDDLDERRWESERADWLQEALRQLSPREIQILESYYGLNGPEKTFNEIGQDLDITGGRVGQIHGRAMGRLKWLLENPHVERRRKKVAQPSFAPWALEARERFLAACRQIDRERQFHPRAKETAP